MREAGKKDRQRLLGFLDKHATAMPRTMLRYAIEHLDKEQRTYYLEIRREQVRVNRVLVTRVGAVLAGLVVIAVFSGGAIAHVVRL